MHGTSAIRHPEVCNMQTSVTSILQAMQSWSAMPVIDLTGRSLHYLYSSWLNMTLYKWTDTVKSI